MTNHLFSAHIVSAMELVLGSLENGRDVHARMPDYSAMKGVCVGKKEQAQ